MERDLDVRQYVIPANPKNSGTTGTEKSF